MDFQATATTQALFDQVIKYLQLTEKFFFGLTQLQGRVHFQKSGRKKLHGLINSKTVECYTGSLDCKLTVAMHRL